MGNSNTHVANALDGPIRVFYSVDAMRLEEMIDDNLSMGNNTGTGYRGPNIGMSASQHGKQVFVRDPHARYIRVPARDYIKISGEGDIYVSVFVEGSRCDGECIQTICTNFHIPYDRSIIVTRDYSIRFKKYNADVWVDEDGRRH